MINNKQNWQIKKLGEVCSISAGNSAPQKKIYFDGGLYPFFRTSDIGKVHIGNITKSGDYLNDSGIKKLKLFRKGTILIPKSGASTFLNHRVIMEVDGYVSSHLATIKTNEHILNTNFLFYLLQEVKAQDLIQDHKYPSLNLPVIESIKIPVPTIFEQQRIVKILDEVFEKIAQAKEDAEKNLQNAKELFESYLHRIFDNPKREWKEKSLGEICSFFNGFAFKSKDSVKISNTQLIRMGNLYQNRLDLDRRAVYYPDDFAINYQKYLLKSDDLIISLTGTTGKEDYGYTVRIPETNRILLLNQRIAKIVILDEKKMVKDYLLHFLLSRTFLDKLYKTANGTRQANLSTDSMKNISLMVPDAIEQKSIVAELDALSTETKKLEAIYKQKLAALEELKKSVLKRAFSGEL